MGFGEEDHRVPFSNHVNSTYLPTWHVIGRVHNIVHLDEKLFLTGGFSTTVNSPLPSFILSLKASLYAQPKPKWVRSAIFHFLKGKVSTSIIWNYSVWEICLYSPLIYVFNHFLNRSIDSKILILLGMVLETKIWALGILLWYHYLAPHGWEKRKYLYVYTNQCAYICLSILYFCIINMSWVYTDLSPAQIHQPWIILVFSPLLV